MITIEQIAADCAENLCREITANLPQYFGLPASNEHYAIGVRSRRNLAAKIQGKYVGLLSLDFPYPQNSSIYWMAVLQDYHGQGVGQTLMKAGCSLAQKEGARTMTVETLSPSETDENYLKTYKFYAAFGFEPLFNLKPQDYVWNMVYMVKFLTA